MAKAALLARPEDLATLTGLPETDARLVLSLRRASDRFYGDTHRENILEATSVHRYNGKGGATLLLRGAPVARVESVTVDGQPLEFPAGYQVDYDAGIIRRRGGVFPAGLGNIEVSYTHGYEEIPGDIEDAVLEHATTIALVLVHIQQESGGSTSASYAKEATVGTTAKWVEAVARYDLDRRA